MDISNFALIDQAVFEPGNGFTIITGETGAGKSLLIDAISALRGNRTGKDAVRSGCKKATIDAIFDQISHRTGNLLRGLMANLSPCLCFVILGRVLWIFTGKTISRSFLSQPCI
jgi:DNA repair ATPase RecN